MSGNRLGLASLFSLVVLLAGGCIITTGTVLAPGQGDYVGEELSFRAYIRETKNGVVTMLARHQVGDVYLLYFSESPAGSEDTSVGDPDDAVGLGQIKRMVSRKGDPVYLFYFDTGRPGFEVFLVALPGDKLGALALVDVGDPEVQAVAQAWGVELVAEDFPEGTGWLPFTANGGDVLGFLTELQARDLLQWEDSEAFSLYDWVMHLVSG